MPVLARVTPDGTLPLPVALSVALDDPSERLLARLRSALRVRSLHAAVLRRALNTEPKVTVPAPAPLDLLDDATVLCVGRGGSYPALSVAIGERVGLIGTLSVETAARYLNARDIDGVVIGEGLGARVVEALLTVLAEDARFRDLPVGRAQQCRRRRRAAAQSGARRARSGPAGRPAAAVRAAAGVRGAAQAHAASRSRPKA